MQCDVLIIGSGIAGSIAALQLAKLKFKVVVITSSSQIADINSYFAQGGIVYKGESDSEKQLAKDIQKTGKGICDELALKQLVKLGPRLVEEILIGRFKIVFDRLSSGLFSYAMEGAHSVARILHCRDEVGKTVLSTLFKKMEDESDVQLFFSKYALELIVEGGRCFGAYVYDTNTAEIKPFFASCTILATGGVGALYKYTTNTLGTTGSGLALAYKGGAKLRHLEYVQFHPTMLYASKRSSVLLSEALRGEGARLLDSDFKPFMDKYDEKKELAPRDIVTLSIVEEMKKSKVDHLWLDISFKNSEWIKNRFPSIYSRCLKCGYDLTKEPVPIIPAAHFLCGGVVVDNRGRTSLPGLRAIGEVACSGVHGANRLASTSLLEALVWAMTTSFDIVKDVKGENFFPKQREYSIMDKVTLSSLEDYYKTIKETMWNYVGVVRTSRGLSQALNIFSDLKKNFNGENFHPHLSILQDALLAAQLITEAAYYNPSSLGCHYRIE